MADPNRLNTLANGLRVLEHLVQRPMSMRELAAAVALPRQTTYRIVATLISEGWVDRDGETYRASPRMWSLAAESFSLTDLRDVLAGTVRRLADEHGESVHLAVYDRGSVVYIDKADGSHPVGSYTTLGGRAPAYCVATGKLLLAHADATTVEQLIAQGLEQHSPLTLTQPDALRLELERVRADGYAVNRGEWRLGVGGVAVPVLSPFNEVVAALGFSGPSDRILARLDELVLALREATGADGTSDLAWARR
jgi:IclR family transcriptional regulator, KDG regulon repressor